MESKIIDIKKEFNISKEEFEEREKKTLEQFLIIVEHIMKSLKILRKDEDLKKCELVLLMVCADVFSRLLDVFEKCREDDKWYIRIFKRLFFKKNNFSNKKRFQKWFDNFVFIDQNKIWKQYGSEINCNKKIIWLLRNSIIHFYGLPNKPSIVLVGGELEKDKFTELKKISNPINIDYLAGAIKEGIIVQLENIKMLLGENPKKYIGAVLEMYEIIKKETTELIKKDYAKNK